MGTPLAAAVELLESSVALPAGRRSTLNGAGGSVQYALALGPAGASTQVLADVGSVAASAAAEVDLVRAALAELLAVAGVCDQLAETLDWLDRALPTDQLDEISAAGGLAWLGVGVLPEGDLRVKVYLNQRWGSSRQRWARLGEFAARFGAEVSWCELVDHAREDFEPAGLALELSAGRSARGRIYLGGFGRSARSLAELAGFAASDAMGDHVERWLRVMLAEDYRYPTRASTFSVALRDGSLRETKVELCAHCAFDDEVQAYGRILTWLHSAKLEVAPYQQLISQGLRHIYVGAGQDGRASLYFAPGAA